MVAPSFRSLGIGLQGFAQGLQQGAQQKEAAQLINLRQRQAELSEIQSFIGIMAIEDPAIQKLALKKASGALGFDENDPDIKELIQTVQAADDETKEFLGSFLAGNKIPPSQLLRMYRDDKMKTIEFLVEESKRQAAAKVFEGGLQTREQLEGARQQLLAAGNQEGAEAISDIIKERFEEARVGLEGARVGLEQQRVGLEQQRITTQQEQFEMTFDLDERQFAFEQLKDQTQQKLEQLKIDLQSRGLDQKDVDLRMTAARDAFQQKLDTAARQLDIKKFDLELGKFEEEKRATGVEEELKTRQVQADEFRTLAGAEDVKESTLKFLLGSRAAGREVRSASKNIQDQINSLTPEQADGVLESLEGAPLVEISPGEQEGEKLAERRADTLITSIDKRGQTAAKKIENADIIRNTIQSGGIEGGPLPDVREIVGQVFELVGLDAGALPDIIGDPTKFAVVRSKANELAAGVAAELPTERFTNAQLNFVREQTPNLAMNNDGILLLSEILVKNAERDIQIQKIKDEFMLGEGRDLFGKDFEVALNKVIRKAEAELEKADPILSPDLINRIRRIPKLSPTSTGGPKAVIIE